MVYQVFDSSVWHVLSLDDFSKKKPDIWCADSLVRNYNYLYNQLFL